MMILFKNYEAIDSVVEGIVKTCLANNYTNLQ